MPGINKATHPIRIYFEDFPNAQSNTTRFGGFMFTRFYSFPFAGIIGGYRAIMLRNPMFVGIALTAPIVYLFRSFYIIEEGGLDRLS